MTAARKGLWLRRAGTGLLGLAGVAIFWLIGGPLPFLLGPLFICLFLALAGVGLSGPPRLWLNIVRTTLGVVAGSSVSPSLLDQLPQTMASVALVPVFLCVSILLGYPFFRFVAGFDKPTAYFATVPGGFAEMILLGQERGGDIRALSLIHATRIMTLVSLTPFVLELLLDVDLSHVPGVAMTSMPLSDLAIMVFCAAAGYWGAVRIGLFGAPILGPMALSAIASLTGLIENRPPTEALILAQFVIGVSIGSNYVGITMQELRRVISASVGYALILGLITIGFAEIVVLMGVNDLLHGFLAFAPGGQPEMVMLAILTGADIAYVIIHHVLRLIIVMSMTPLVARWLA